MTTTNPTTTSTMTTEPQRSGTRVPARAQIMGWMLLVLVVVLTGIVLLVWRFLHNDAMNKVTASLEQEGGEFVNFAQVGRHPATGALIAEPGALFDTYLRQQYPDSWEVMIGAWDTPTGLKWHMQSQDKEIREVVHDPGLLDRIVADPNKYGTAQTGSGPLRWIKIQAHTDGGQQAWFITGHFTTADVAEVHGVVRILVLVSAFGVLLAAASSWVVAGAILAPVRTVRQAAAEISEHDLTRRIPVEGRDDIAALAYQFNAMLDRLESAFSTQRQFVDDASHELRTPITIVRGHLELLGDDPDERDEVVRLCTDELDRMTRIVEDLLMLAKADRPDFVHPAEVSLAELTSDIDAKVRSIADRRWVLESIGEGDVVVDAQRLTQAVVQLAQNAVQHTEDGAEIRIGSTLSLGRLTLWVTDRGPGVDPAEVEQIFARFAHGSGPGRGGAGLGLAIVAAIAEAHHGRVRVLSEPGAGATFGLDLPARPGAALGPAAPATVEEIPA
ncbi:ATP-binding protein [Saccharopolyspora sp. NFXS83]|uniref:sensor histidine kinase n=1 Tax=Saccharopolyspora sp. NFXS83 TaxID=2993560 RepID=UPI00224A5B88|nr:ATP-binding protein [Saccharopolyspora sp. NFXS83]MCX2731228.1 ATP-binding protein [Saccharopolyspora sp. NFXS83]